MTLMRNRPDLGPDEIRVPEDVPAADPLRVQAVDAFAADIAAGAVPSIRAIRSAVHVGQPRGQQIQTYLATLARA